MNNEYYVKNIMLFLSGFLSIFFGNSKTAITLVYALLIMMGFDIFTGVLKAFAMKKNKISSAVFSLGIFKKLGILTAVSFCYFLDSYKLLNIGISLESCVAVIFVLNECISIIENLGDMGITQLTFLKEKLLSLEKENENNINIDNKNNPVG